MTDQTRTSLRRAHLGVTIWLDLLPKDAQLDAKMALDKLVVLAEREIEQAYHEGQDFDRSCRRVEEYRPAQRS
jgi:hypothetical protein